MILSAPDDVYSHICLLFGQLIQLSSLNIFRLCCGHTHTHAHACILHGYQTEDLAGNNWLHCLQGCISRLLFEDLMCDRNHSSPEQQLTR